MTATEQTNARSRHCVTAPTITELIPMCDALIQEIRIALDKGTQHDMEEASAKSLEMARYCSRTAHGMECPVVRRAEGMISRAEIDAQNPLLNRSAS